MIPMFFAALSGAVLVSALHTYTVARRVPDKDGRRFGYALTATGVLLSVVTGVLAGALYMRTISALCGG